MNNVKYHYIRTDNANSLKCKEAHSYGGVSPFSDGSEHRGDPFACVAYQVVEHAATNTREVWWALATLNPEDGQFLKETARTAALGRLNKDKTAHVFNLKPLQTKGRDVHYEIMKRLANPKEYGLGRGDVPSRVTKAAKKWLKGS